MDDKIKKIIEDNNSELTVSDYLSIANYLSSQNQYDLAVKFMEIYCLKEENLPLMCIEAANFYKSIGDYKNAIKYFEKFMELDSTKCSVYTVTADLYSKLYGDESLDIQLNYYLKAYDLQPENRLVLHALAFIYEKLEDNANAEKYYKLILENNPSEIDYFNYGMFLIHCGKIFEGHKYLTHRFNIDDINLKYPIDDTRKWDLKSDIKDKTLLVCYEQGFGDTIMYCRFVPMLKNIAKHVIFLVQDELLELMKISPVINDGIEIISNKSDLKNIEYDFSMALLDTPFVLGIDKDSIPFAMGYLKVRNEDITSYANKNLLKNNNIDIGIAYSGDINANYESRNISPDKFEILANIDGFCVYSFSKSDNIAIENIRNLGDTFDNFYTTACALKNMDVVISTDNVILNLAGALGVKTIGLFNKETNFRWFKTVGEDVYWYKSVKPLQNKIKNDWNDSFSTILKFLKEK